MEKQIQEQELLWEKAEKVFEKLLAGWELEEEEILLLRNPQFRRCLAKILEAYPHGWI